MEVHSQIYAMATLHFEKEPLHSLLTAGQAAELVLILVIREKSPTPARKSNHYSLDDQFVA